MRQTKFIRNISLGIENLLLHKLRSFLTMLGVVFGVGSVVAMLSVGEGASKEALEQIRKLGSNNIIINSVKSVEEESTSKTHSFMGIYGLTYDDHVRIAESFNTIKRVAPVKLIRKESRLGEKSMELRVVGTTPVWFKLIPRADDLSILLLPCVTAVIVLAVILRYIYILQPLLYLAVGRTRVIIGASRI